MKEPYFSIIIPTYNSADTLKPLLNSIYKSTFVNFEVTVVDDVSTDDTQAVVKKYKKVKYHRLKTNRGSGGARNEGVKPARGKVLVFMDSDIVLYKNTLEELIKSFRHKRLKVVVGAYDKIPANPKPGLFHWFKAMRDWAYWNLERDESFPIGGFGGAIAAIDKKLFKKLGGFDETFRGAGMEDQEMGWRINHVTEIIFNPKVLVKHNYGGFIKTLKRFYLRSYLWMNLFRKYKKFFGPAMNPKEAFVAGLANLSTLFFILAWFWGSLWYVFVLVFTFRIFLGRKFLLSILKEKGFFFLLVSFFFSHSLYLAVYLGVSRAILARIFRL